MKPCKPHSEYVEYLNSSQILTSYLLNPAANNDIKRDWELFWNVILPETVSQSKDQCQRSEREGRQTHSQALILAFSSLQWICQNKAEQPYNLNEDISHQWETCFDKMGKTQNETMEGKIWSHSAECFPQCFLGRNGTRGEKETFTGQLGVPQGTPGDVCGLS